MSEISGLNAGRCFTEKPRYDEVGENMMFMPSV
jgi:hypothetical protein